MIAECLLQDTYELKPKLFVLCQNYSDYDEESERLNSKVFISLLDDFSTVSSRNFPPPLKLLIIVQKNREVKQEENIGNLLTINTVQLIST